MLWLFLAASASGQEWPQFRGPDGQGHAIESTAPVAWSENENVLWKTPLPGVGWSSPVIAGPQVWMTACEEATGSLTALCVDGLNGQLRQRVEVFRLPDLGRIAPKNSHASPTPVLDGGHIYVHYGAHGTACLTPDGRILWSLKLPYNHHHGPGASPVVWNGLLLIVCDGLDEQFVVALDKLTGQVMWQKPRAGEHSYCTPLLVRGPTGDQLICPGGKGVTSYHPGTGEEIWHVAYDGHSVVPRPVIGHGLVYICSGYWNPTLYALRMDGRGDVTATHVAWSIRRSIPHNPSPILAGSELYYVTDQGVTTCVDARTGKEQWRQRLEGDFSASPLESGGRLYFTNEDGTTYVLAGGPKFQILATNRIEGRTMASLAAVGNSIFLRSDTALYRLAGGAGPNPAVAGRPAPQPGPAIVR